MKKIQFSTGQLTANNEFLFVSGPLGRIGINFKWVNSNLHLGLISTWLKRKEPSILNEKVLKEAEINNWVRHIHYPSPQKNLLKKHADTNFSTQNWRKQTLLKLISNCEQALTNGISCELNIVGIGYKREITENKLILSVGRRHQIPFHIPEGLQIIIPKGYKGQKIVIFGLNLEEVKNFGSQIRSILPPERYKGKGILWKDEIVVLKEGKK